MRFSHEAARIIFKICKVTNISRIGTVDNVGMQLQVNNAYHQKETTYKLKYDYVTINDL